MSFHSDESKSDQNQSAPDGNSNDGRMLALARDAWLLSPRVQSLLDGTASGEYLRNRLINAFYDGWDAHRRLATTDPT